MSDTYPRIITNGVFYRIEVSPGMYQGFHGCTTSCFGLAADYITLFFAKRNLRRLTTELQETNPSNWRPL